MYLILTICHVHSAVTQSEGRVPEHGGESVCSGHDLKILISVINQHGAICMTLIWVSSIYFLLSFIPVKAFIQRWFAISLLAFPTSRWLHNTSAAAWCGTCETCGFGVLRRASSTSAWPSTSEPFTWAHCSGKKTPKCQNISVSQMYCFRKWLQGVNVVLILQLSI